MPRLNDVDVPMLQAAEAVFLMQGERPLGSSKLGGTEAETKSYLPARPGLFFNCMFPLEGPIRVNRPENGHRTILADVDLHVLFANCEVALELLTRLSSQPWCSITGKESRFLRLLMTTDIPAVDLARSLRFLRTDPQTSIAVFHDVACAAPRADNMPSFLSDAALARYLVVGDELKRKDNMRMFLDACNEHHDPSPYARIEPQFSESDYVVDFQDCVQDEEDVKIERFVVDSKAGKRLYPLHREAVLENLDRCRWFTWGKQDHLIFHDKPRKLNEDKEKIWNGHSSPRNVHS
ncbi:hypothetical protein INS49_015056 [Diaporthe citri]|uniref:uncharacterized protein n=1 Tax=Diaporthe citri TaxID=83186 RepID=UPI001C7F7335|nr:uncharacterized protein INS49_015056 [Diaporthe citri]KAG6357178.1 hypothetical protein INS49_015056 [Diaporthe citri]